MLAVIVIKVVAKLAGLLVAHALEEGTKKVLKKLAEEVK